MVFLIEYSRSEGRIVNLREFGPADRLDAETVLLELELRLMSEGIDHEVVLLDAENEAALRRTHSRYFPVTIWPEPDIEWPEGTLPDHATGTGEL